MTPGELHDLLDSRMAKVILDTKEEAGDMDAVRFSGTVSGFLIKTGIHLAAVGGCPNDVLRTQVSVIIKDAYAGKPKQGRKVKKR